MMKVLVVDIGGSHVKMLASGQSEPRRFDSGKDLTPRMLVEGIQAHVRGWDYDVIALGYPAAVGPKGPVAEPGNLGRGWVGFDFAAAFGRPVRVANDAGMQALGGYDGGRMLFLGLGTGLGSALVADRVVIPLELGDLPVGSGEVLSDRLGKRGLDRLGQAAWKEAVVRTVLGLRKAFAVDSVLVGGGNAERLDELPEGVRRGGNDDAFRGGFRLWEEYVSPHDSGPDYTWRIVR
jgi:polyphosphate glucokinase